VQQCFDVGDRKISELARQLSRRRNANAEEMIAGAVLTGSSLKESLQKQRVVGIAFFLKPAPNV